MRIKRYYPFINESKSIGRIILTGVPGGGKTTVLEALQQMGYPIVIEAARGLILHLKKHDPSKLPWVNRDAFQELVQIQQVNNFKKHPNGFYDRGLVDEIAYHEGYGREVPTHLDEICRNNRYDKVFLFPPFKEIYQQDDARTETFEESERMHDFFVKAYKEYGYDPIVMEKTTIENRVKYILNEIT